MSLWIQQWYFMTAFCWRLKFLSFISVKSDPKNIVKILQCPATVEEGVWKYEHLRQFCMELNGMAVLLQARILFQFQSI